MEPVRLPEPTAPNPSVLQQSSSSRCLLRSPELRFAAPCEAQLADRGPFFRL